MEDVPGYGYCCHSSSLLTITARYRVARKKGGRSLRL